MSTSKTIICFQRAFILCAIMEIIFMFIFQVNIFQALKCNVFAAETGSRPASVEQECYILTDDMARFRSGHLRYIWDLLRGWRPFSPCTCSLPASPPQLLDHALAFLWDRSRLTGCCLWPTFSAGSFGPDAFGPCYSAPNDW